MSSRRKIFRVLFLGFVFFFAAVGKVRAVIPAIYDNPGQGVFQCHDNGNIDQDYLKGGGVIVRWDELQPVDGDYLDQTALTALANKIKNGGKKVYLHFQIYAILQGTANKNVLPSWLYPQVVTVAINNSRHPVPWDPVYQQKLSRFLGLLAAGLIEKAAMSNVEYIEPAAGGMWGSTHLYRPARDLCNLAVAAGCSISPTVCGTLPANVNQTYCSNYSNVWQCLGNKFNQGVTAVFEKYFTAFPNFAMMRLGGSCLCGSMCNYTGESSLIEKYGLRFMIKGAGLGDPGQPNCGMLAELGPACAYKGNMTKCGQEPWQQSMICGGGSGGFGPGCYYKNSYNNSLNTEKISYSCAYSQDIGCNSIDPGSGETINNINRWIAEHIGAQIFITNKSLDSLRKNVGGTLTVSITGQNRGSAPLVAPLKQGIKWVPSSYKLFVEFVKNGSVVNYQESALSVPTQQWVTLPNSTPVSTTASFGIPSVLGGAAGSSESVYKVYIGLTDPNGERKRFALRNSGSENDLTNRRYLLADSFTVVGVGTGPPSTLKIMPLGDSLTEGDYPNGGQSYRGYLRAKLITGGYTNFDFVGDRSKRAHGDVSPYDLEHSGHGGYTIGPDIQTYGGVTTGVFEHIQEWLNVSNPDIILMLIGVNDVINADRHAPNYAQTAPDRLVNLVQKIQQLRPNVKIIISSLLKLRDSTNDWPAYNAVNAKAAQIGNASSTDNVFFVNLNAVNLTAGDYFDGAHLSESGGRKVADGWYPALIPFLSGSPQPTTPPTTSCSCPSGKMAKSLGNANCDDVIDGIDFGIWREEFLGLRPILDADFDCSRGVNGIDFEIWRRNHNAPALNLTAVCNSGTSATLSWNAVANKNEYWVGMCDHTIDTNCTNQIAFRNQTESVERTVIPNHWYGWWITAFDSAGNVLLRATASNWFKCPQ